MLDIEVVIKSLEVTEYTKELLQLTVIFVDDKEKAIKHDVDIQNSEEAERIIKKIRDYGIYWWKPWPKEKVLRLPTSTTKTGLCAYTEKHINLPWGSKPAYRQAGL